MDTAFQATTRRDRGRVTISLRLPIATESGRRQDAKGRRIPPAFVRTLSVEWAGAVVFTAHLGPNLACYPTVAFDVDGAKKGDVLRVAWTDQSGARVEQDVTLDA
jgi:sulfur-oxidizing protein SoxZ